jgi:hypothetical protein
LANALGACVNLAKRFTDHVEVSIH